jgi:excisionase family DNA binding protein
MSTTAPLTTQPPQPPHPATMTIPEAAKLLGISRSAAYRAVARGEIPTIRIGRRLLVPTAKLYQLLGWLPEATD